MKFTNDQIIEALKAPRYKVDLHKAKLYEEKIRLYTEPQEEEDLKNDQSFRNLCKKIETRLPPKAYGRVLDFIEYPIGAVDLVNGIVTELFKVFQAKDTYFSFEVNNEAKNKKVADLVKAADVQQYVIETGKQVLRNKPNLIVVIDKNDNGEPYIVTIDAERVIDAKINLDGKMEYIAFYKTDDDINAEVSNICFYDDENYNVIKFEKRQQRYTVEKTIAHKIGYCPARCFINKPLNKKNAYKRRTPVASALGKITEWQLMSVYKYYTEHYAAFPVIQSPKQKCSNPQCQGGFIEGEPFFEDGNLKRLPSTACPSCKNESNIVMGSTIIIQPKQSDEDNQADIFKFIDPGTEGLKYLSDKLESLEQYIQLKIVGKNNLLTDQAVNSDQVKGSFQSQDNVLMDLKEVFEDIHIWLVETAARAFYLGNIEITCFANYGSVFYVVDAEKILQKYKDAVTSGMPESEIDAIFRQYIAAKYKDNPDEITRMEIIRLIDPLPYKSFAQALEYKTNGAINEVDFIVKVNLTKFINRFELEQADLATFGKTLPLPERIKKISEILNKYSNEYTIKSNPEPVAGS